MFLNFDLMEKFSSKTKRLNINFESSYLNIFARMDNYRQPNMSSVTEYLTITGKVSLVELMQLL